MSALVAPRRFRRRLTFAFVAFVGVSSGVLAVGSYFMFREYRLRLSATQADRRVALALPLLPPNPDGAEARHALAEYRRRGGFEAVVVTHGHMYSSLPGLGAHDIPADLRAGLTRRDHHTFTTVAGNAYRVVGRLADDGNTRLYFYFARAEVLSSISLFGNVLAIAWLGTVAFAAVAGQVVSRRTLRPIREAALASRRLASGLLDQRVENTGADEFSLWVASFNDVAVALETKIAELSNAAERERQFTSDVAHELRTPLTGMTSAASLIEDTLDDLPPAAREPVSLLVRDTQRLRELVLELLELARLDAGAEAVNLEPLSVAPAVATVVRPWLERPNVDIRVEMDSGLSVLADRSRLRRVLDNLVANAVEHGDGTVTVSAVWAGDAVAISVLDRGPGIDHEHIDHVFDRFYKVDGSRSTRGSGLGLAIALAHARAQGGTLRVHNVAGAGACFTLTLPAAPVVAVERRVA